MTDTNLPETVLFPFGFGDTPVTPDKDVMGTKGANLAEMANAGLPVPPGFVLSVQLGAHIAGGEDTIDPQINAQVRAAIGQLETEMGRPFGKGATPLLLSVRSGATVSMPGMMDTVLNLGLNSQNV
ncbi:MAG: pyruvate, phosphate dikinase, partial [Rhizobiaceae bacterium]|nr:pyruvate, phosphate dikinase [Rhizobiaceae bacterium]